MNREELLAALKEPFNPSVIQWKIGVTNKKKVQRETGNQNARPTKAQVMPYIRFTDIAKRLDEVVGIDGWQTVFPFKGCCELSLKMPDGTWITKSNCAGETDVEGEKGAATEAFKRAAVMFGVFRYAYYVPKYWVDIDQYGKFKEPQLPQWALPKEKS